MKFGRAPTTCKTFILNSLFYTRISILFAPFRVGLVVVADGWRQIETLAYPRESRHVVASDRSGFQARQCSAAARGRRVLRSVIGDARPLVAPPRHTTQRGFNRSTQAQRLVVIGDGHPGTLRLRGRMLFRRRSFR